MKSKIVETLEMMCDKDNAQDKKLLLLAELVEAKCEALAENQVELKEKLSETNGKLDKLTAILEKYEHVQEECPVSQHKEYFENFVIVTKHPKIALLLIVGAISLLIGMFSSTFMELLKYIFG